MAGNTMRVATIKTSGRVPPKVRWLMALSTVASFSQGVVNRETVHRSQSCPPDPMTSWLGATSSSLDKFTHDSNDSILLLFLHLQPPALPARAPLTLRYSSSPRVCRQEQQQWTRSPTIGRLLCQPRVVCWVDVCSATLSLSGIHRRTP